MQETDGWIAVAACAAVALQVQSPRSRDAAGGRGGGTIGTGGVSDAEHTQFERGSGACAKAKAIAGSDAKRRCASTHLGPALGRSVPRWRPRTRVGPPSQTRVERKDSR